MLSTVVCSGPNHQFPPAVNASDNSPGMIVTCNRLRSAFMIESITAEDGHKLSCWIDKAKGRHKGGLVIIQEIFGVTDQLKGVASHYSALGYNVIVPALFDRQQRDAVISFDQAATERDLMLAAKLDETLLDIKAAVEALDDDAVAVIGFCWGGGLAVRAAQKLDIAGAVSFYGTRLSSYLDCQIKAPVLAHFGTQDDHTPAEVIAETKAYLPAMEVHMYEAGHAFANDARADYVAEAAELAHSRSERFLEKVLVGKNQI